MISKSAVSDSLFRKLSALLTHYIDDLFNRLQFAVKELSPSSSPHCNLSIRRLSFVRCVNNLVSMTVD